MSPSEDIVDLSSCMLADGIVVVPCTLMWFCKITISGYAVESTVYWSMILSGMYNRKFY